MELKDRVCLAMDNKEQPHHCYNRVVGNKRAVAVVGEADKRQKPEGSLVDKADRLGTVLYDAAAKGAGLKEEVAVEAEKLSEVVPE